MYSIWAVAVNTIKQALRMKVAVVFVVLLLVLLPVLGFSTTGDGTLKGRLQTFVSYGLSLTSLLLCLLTVVISIYSVTSDIEQKQVYTVLTKPIRRFQLLLGKLLGVIILDVCLLGLFSAIVYIITIYMPFFIDATEAELKQAQNQFYTARASITVPEVDVSKEVNQQYQELDRSGQLEEIFKGLPRKEILSHLTKLQQVAKRSADVGKSLLWQFKNVDPIDPNMYIRFKYDVALTPPDSQVYGRWYAGDYRYFRYGEKPKTEVYDQLHKNSVRTFHEIEIPSKVVPEDGGLAVAFLNVRLNNTPIIFPLDGLEILYKASSFGGNFVRAVALILSRLIFLACLGVLASSFLSFPVAIMLCLVLFFTASFSGFVIESFDYLSANMGLFYSYTIKWMIRLLPQFDRFNPSEYMIPGRLVSWSLVAECVAFMVCIKAFLLLVIALIIFSYREIAKITV